MTEASPLDDPRPILEHLDELRSRLFKISIAVVLAGIGAAVFADPLRVVLEAPFHAAAPEASLQTLAPGEQWGVLMRIGLFGGLIIASPVVLYQIWAFILPALTGKERRSAIPVVAALVVLFVGGVVFGYLVLPRGLAFLLGIFGDVDNNLRMGEYYSFVLRFLLAFGATFLFPVFLIAAAAAGIIGSEHLARGRRWAVLVMVIGAALITPTGDALTLVALTVPLYLLYEACYWVVRLVLRK
ncbi:MAG: twin-arginine translocase subunit TatC [Acidimicrobiia bacterium]|nr:twin-arginine translocase subunit TatC [Acidimicrobiia bacterium]